MARILAIDYGDRHLGLALSDPLEITAQPFGTYTLKTSEQENGQFFSNLVKEKNIEEIILGLPIRMDGSEGSRAELTRKFASWLEAVTGKKVILWDERLTTKEALKRLDSFKGNFREKKEKEDELAAVIILETYLEKKRYDAYHSEKNS
ncbi:MAG TPA: Holliday junction resolvase RuvX [Candidatus Saccharicenans sp.]|jgi:putative Holliday junction resolvase|nr:Holliday junction resolvase RuvX [Candidatus Saccharicenans sp.]HRD01866.1 Holliday junction resolvase RuvX [Candidatus Saccharicenans sp.]